MSHPSSRRLPSLDGLRALSIALVLVGHLAGTRHFLAHATVVARAGDLGNLGVRVFFIISGFLITGLLAAEREKTGGVDLQAFYIRRALRIFPAFFVFVFVAICLGRLGFATVNRGDVLHAITYTANYRGSTDTFSLRHLWSLSVEEQFYLIWPLTFAGLSLAGDRRALAAVLVLAPVLRVALTSMYPGYIELVPTAFESVCDALATGCLMALILPALRRTAWFTRIVFHRLMPLALVVVWIANRQGDHPKFFWLFCIPMMNVLIALVMVRYVERPSLFFGRVLNARPLASIGALSYSLYLWQELFLIQWRPPVSVLQTFPANVIAALACAAASYRFVERPFLRLKKEAAARRASVIEPESGRRGTRPAAPSLPTNPSPASSPSSR